MAKLPERSHGPVEFIRNDSLDSLEMHKKLEGQNRISGIRDDLNWNAFNRGKNEAERMLVPSNLKNTESKS